MPRSTHIFIHQLRFGQGFYLLHITVLEIEPTNAKYFRWLVQKPWTRTDNHKKNRSACAEPQ